MRTRLPLLAAAVLLLGACGNGDDTTAVVDPSTISTTVATTTIYDPTTETDRIIDAWIEAWMDEDVDGVADLYAEDGVYADVGCPFEMDGQWEIRNMVGGHLTSTDYAIVDRVETTYTESGAVVQWVWGGTHDLEPFTMEPSTTFEIENGLIVKSTDSYERSDAPPGWEQACIDYAGE